MINKGDSFLWISDYFLVNTNNYNVDKPVEKLDKYLTFALGDEAYGLEIMQVREIFGLMPITRVPAYVRGVINLRGKVIPVVDLRLKFGMPGVEDTKETCIIVVNIDGLLIGIVVDRVTEVLDITEEKIEETSTFGVNVDTQFIMGLGKVGDKVVILLDILKVLTAEELAVVAGAEDVAP